MTSRMNAKKAWEATRDHPLVKAWPKMAKAKSLILDEHVCFLQLDHFPIDSTIPLKYDTEDYRSHSLAPVFVSITFDMRPDRL